MRAHIVQDRPWLREIRLAEFTFDDNPVTCEGHGPQLQGLVQVAGELVAFWVEGDLFAAGDLEECCPGGGFEAGDLGGQRAGAGAEVTGRVVEGGMPGGLQEPPALPGPCRP